jgi:hypothetical protein
MVIIYSVYVTILDTTQIQQIINQEVCVVIYYILIYKYIMNKNINIQATHYITTNVICNFTPVFTAKGIPVLLQSECEMAFK